MGRTVPCTSPSPGLATEFYYLGSARRSEDIESVINPTGPAVPESRPQSKSTLYSDWEEQNDDMMRPDFDPSLVR